MNLSQAPYARFCGVVLLVLAAASGAQEGRWLTSLAEGKRQALATRRPVLCVLLKPGARNSKRLERDLEKSGKITALLDSFVCVKLDWSKSRALRDRYGLKHEPSTLYLTMTGAPMKVVVGPTSSSKYAAQMKAALEKHESLWRPRRPTAPKPTPPPEETPSETKPAPHLVHAPGCPDGCPHCEAAIGKAVAWLLRRQSREGAFPKPPSERVTKNDEGKIVTRSIDHIDVALTAVAGLALMSRGSTTKAGRHRTELARAARFVQGSVRPDGILCREKGNDHLYLTHANFETPLGAMFLAEVQKADPDPARADVLKLVAGYLAGVQDPRTGAWGYGPDFREHHPWTRRGWRLLATTVCAVTALESIRDAGVEVDGDAIARGARYLLACQGRDGAFVYRAEYRGKAGDPGTTASALFPLSRSGTVGDGVLAAIRARHRQHYREIDHYGEHWWYFLLFTALAMNDQGPGAFEDFDYHFRDRLIADQKPDGTWDEPDANGGSVFSTAVGALVLSMKLGHLPLLGARRPPPEIDLVADPEYLKPPHPGSRVKVFRHGGAYRADLTVSIDGAADDTYLAQLREGILDANRRLYDVTDGQMMLHRVRILTGRKEWATADIMISPEFRDRDVNPNPWAHGITQVSKRTDLVGDREKERPRIGDWIMFPRSGIRWDSPRFGHVLAHEICHYLFGLLDEYDTRTGEARCECIMGKRRYTELCTDATHADPRSERSCWSQAKLLYPKLVVPVDPDPGPWDPPMPAIVVER